jgi:hypothetical protein
MAEPPVAPAAVTAEPEPEDDGQALWDELEGAEAHEAQPATEPAPAPAPAEVSSEPPAAGIWSGASEAQLAAYRSLEHGARSNAGRISALNRRIAELQAQQPEPPAAGTGNGADPGPAKPLPTGKAWETLAADYPEIAEAMQAALGESYAQIEARNARVERVLASLEEHRATSEAYESEDALEALSPGWREFLDEHRASLTPWIQAQPRHMQEAFQRNVAQIVDPAEAADVIGRFRQAVHAAQTGAGASHPPAVSTATPQSSAPLSARRQSQRLSAQPIRSATPAAAVNGIPDDEKAAWAYYERVGM